MNVNLFKKEEVGFNLPEEKCEKVSHNLFRMLIGYQEIKAHESNNPKMVVFKTKEEYQQEAYKYNLDLNKEVLINQKGNIFCYLTEDTTKSPNKSEETTDVTTNTEEN